jgi:hypothetical protein
MVSAKGRGPNAAKATSHSAAAKKTAAEREYACSFRSQGGSPPASKANQMSAPKNKVDGRKNGHEPPASHTTAKKKPDRPTATNPG